MDAAAASMLEEARVVIMVSGRLLAYDYSSGEDASIPPQIMTACAETDGMSQAVVGLTTAVLQVRAGAARATRRTSNQRTHARARAFHSRRDCPAQHAQPPRPLRATRAINQLSPSQVSPHSLQTPPPPIPVGQVLDQEQNRLSAQAVPELRSPFLAEYLIDYATR